MAQMYIDVISVEGPTPVKTAKGSYSFMEVAFKKDGKVEGKKVMDFASREMFNFLKSGEVKAGMGFNVQMEKDGNGYWQWTAMEATGTVPAADPTGDKSASNQGPTSTSSRNGVGRVVGNTYETPEERLVKQRHIARQSSLGYALSFFELTKGKPTAGDVEELAERFVKFVYKQHTATQELAALKDDIPL